MSSPTPSPAPDKPLCNSYGREYTYQSVADFNDQVQAAQNEYRLATLRKELVKGNDGFCTYHGWKWGSDELIQAFTLLKRKARDLGFEWSDRLRRYILINNPNAAPQAG